MKYIITLNSGCDVTIEAEGFTVDGSPNAVLKFYREGNKGYACAAFINWVQVLPVPA